MVACFVFPSFQALEIAPLPFLIRMTQAEKLATWLSLMTPQQIGFLYV